MRAHVTFRMPDGSSALAGHGDLVGRLHSAAVFIDDVRVSEAHAMVSLRGSKLYLLGLRGRFAVDGKTSDSVALQPGMKIYLARQIVLEVDDVVLPDGVLGLRGPNMTAQVLPGVASLYLKPAPRLVPRFASDADACFWTTGSDWRYTVGDSAARGLVPGASFAVGDQTFEAVLVDLAAAGQAMTVREGRLVDPLEIVAMFDTVLLRRAGAAVVTLSGLPARIICELAEIGVPVAWGAVAQSLWKEGDADSLRHRWDLALSRLRRKLREAGVRQDLVHADGTGNVQLLLYGDDRVEIDA